MKIQRNRSEKSRRMPFKCVKYPRRKDHGLPCVISRKLQTQISLDTEPQVAKIPNLVNPEKLVNLVKIFQNSKFDLQNSLKIENSLFKINTLPILPIFTFQPGECLPKHVHYLSEVVHFLSKHDHFLTEIFRNRQKYSEI